MRRSTKKMAFSLFAGAVLLPSLQGCIATRGWVTEQLSPLEGRMSEVEGRLAQTDAKADSALAKADKALDALDHLRLEKRFVLDLKEGANFSLNATALTPDARRAIDGFLSDLKETEGTLFLVAGHTDNVGSQDYNYELGQKRANTVARYLISKGADPLRVTAVSYGASAPLGDNGTREGRRKNRRIEILVYKEAISAPSSSVVGASR